MPAEAIARMAKPHHVPILVDAAAEILTIPSVHLERGATMVCYSGGKLIRVRRAPGCFWAQGPRAGGVGSQRAASRLRQETEGRTRRGLRHAGGGGELGQARSRGRVETMGGALRLHRESCDEDPGITASVRREPGHRNNRSARVSLRWDSKTVGITGPEVANILDRRRAPHRTRRDGGRSAPDASGDTGISINTAIMADGDEKIVAEAVYKVLSAKHTPKPVASGAAGGQRERALESRHPVRRGQQHAHRGFAADGNRLQGTHQGDFVAASSWAPSTATA